MRLLLILLLLVPSLAQAQNPVGVDFVLSQGRHPNIDTLIYTVAIIDSAQQEYFAEHGNFAWHPDSLAMFGVKLLCNRIENKVRVLPWRVEMIELSRKDTTSKPQTWRVVVVFQDIMCWYPEVLFGPLPPHIDVDVPELSGLACGPILRKPTAATKI